MAYILDDNKNHTSSYLSTLGNTDSPKIEANVDTQIKAELSIGPDNNTKYIFPATRSPGPGYVLEDTLGDGNLKWVLSSGGGGSSGNPSFNFKRITDLGTNYILGEMDYAIEIVSDTYNTVTLPTALNKGGRVYLISRGSNNDNLQLVAQVGETIDDTNSYKYLRKYTRMSVMSNSVDKWYII